MNRPISPAPVKGGGRDELPAYVANGVVGLRVREVPLAGGLALISGYTGEHPERGIEAIAIAPYPVAGDIQLSGVWLSESPHAISNLDQAYDFETGELRSRFEFTVGGAKASIEVLLFCSREEPSLVCQDIAIKVDQGVDLALKVMVDGRGVDGRALRHQRDTPGEEKPACDGAALWESAGALSTCGIAYVTEVLGADTKPDKPPLENRTLATCYAFKARAGRTYHVRQMASLIPSVTHAQPDFQAVRLIALASKQIRKSGATCGRGGLSSWERIADGRL